MKTKFKRVLTLLLTLAVVVSAMDVRVFAAAGGGTPTKNNELRTTNASVSQAGVTEEEDPMKWDGVTKRSVYEGENFSVTYTLTNCWDLGYQGTIEIKNNDQVKMENWSLGFSSDSKLKNIWNAKIESHEDGLYLLKNAGHNQDIEANQSVSFGFIGEGKFTGFPETYELYSECSDVGDESYAITYQLENDWGSGFTGTITITNNSDTTIEDWILDFDFARDIKNVWNGKIESSENGHYRIRNASYNANIAPGSTVRFGFNGKKGVKEDSPKNYQLQSYQTQSSDKKGAHRVRFDLCYKGAPTPPEKQVVEANQKVIKPVAPERDRYAFLGWYTDQKYTQAFDFENTILKNDMTLYARWFDLYCETDQDQDGMDDAFEDLIGTNRNQKDSDGDGLDDDVEILYFDTDPVLVDTDSDGIPDGEEDKDQDGLGNQMELQIGSDPLVVDTDQDELSDGEEYNQYKTNPLAVDTDGDAVSDGKEVEIGSNPLVKEDVFEVTMESKDRGAVKASVSMTLQGNQVDSLEITKDLNEFLFPKDMPGFIGEAYDFSVDGTFDEATIQFTFDESLLDSPGFDPVVYYFNEEEQELEPLETTINGTVASAKTTHFSKYILLNRKVYETSKLWVDDWDTTPYTGVEVVLVIDDSGSMPVADPNNERFEVAKDLIQKLPKNSKVGVVQFAYSTNMLTPKLSSDKEEASKYLSEEYFHSTGGTYMNAAIQEACSLYETENEHVLKMMIVLTDGWASDTERHSQTIVTANANKVKLYTVGLGKDTTYFDSYLKPLANNTAGEFYLATDATKLAKIYDSINRKINLSLDSDNDSIPDYYEENMVMFNGKKLSLNKNNPDTDGDGLKDGEEVVIKITYSKDKTKARVSGHIISNPSGLDSDGDGLYDYSPRRVKGEIVAPIDDDIWHPSGLPGMWDAHVQQQSVQVSTEYADPTDLQEDLHKCFEEVATQEVADAIVKKLLILRETALKNEGWLRYVLLHIKGVCNEEANTIVGAYLLEFIKDEDGVAYHSQIDTWQRVFGYNRLYDDGFRIGSYMHKEPYDFSVKGSVDTGNYMLWLWKGDYWNLHSGAEVGIYKWDGIYSGTNHYDAIDYEVPMTLGLYYYNSGSNIDNCFNWAPTDDQWWITGFTGQNPAYLNPKLDRMVMVSSVNLSSHKEMYEALKSKDKVYAETYIKWKQLDLAFDDSTSTVWINWYKGVENDQTTR